MDCRYLKKLNGNEIVERLSESDEKLFSDLYICSKSIVVGWIRKNLLISEEDALEIYQTVFITFFKKIKNGQQKPLTGAPSSYLIGIAKNLIRNNRRRKKRTLLDINIESLGKDLKAFQLPEKNKLKEESFKKFDAGFLQLDEKCQDILMWHYYNGMKFKEIALELNLKSAEVARSTKERCMKKIRKLMNS